MTDWKDLLCKSIKVLGLNVQGIDVILDRDDNLYFLEIQPTYNAGYEEPFNRHHPYKPPFYHPYKDDLIKFIMSNKELISQSMHRGIYFQVLIKELNSIKQFINP